MQNEFTAIVQEFYAALEATNAKLRQRIFINETVRKENFADYEAVAAKIAATLNAVTEIDRTVTPSVAVEAVKRGATFTKNEAAVEFCAMYTLKRTKKTDIAKFSRAAELRLERALKQFAPIVSIHRFMGRLYVTLVFDQHRVPKDTSSYTVVAMSNTSNLSHEACLIANEVYNEKGELCYVDSPVANHKRFNVEVRRSEVEAKTPSEAISLFKQQNHFVA